ncbi:MAG: class I SAM-dependent methyltransferase [Actinomycetaceae bacterium]|nr:class I SAM-dependent methyltransferase [Actinomycetaceae bacterium]MDU0970533.1 class I SAM-dependent methyltransferase [Actinomycetaceae bacterium]
MTDTTGMQPNYENWMPRHIIGGYAALGGLAMASTPLVRRWLRDRPGRHTATVALPLVGGLMLAAAVDSAYMRHRFAFTEGDCLARRVVTAVPQALPIPDSYDPESGQPMRILDVGCGSGALTIACAKQFPDAHVVGVDRWGMDYVSYSAALCCANARAEGVTNTEFMQGDALALPFPDESFDALISNYVYHNIHRIDHGQIIIDNLRVLKPGGTFAIQDIFAPPVYGPMDQLIRRLTDLGFTDVTFQPTDCPPIMESWESRLLMVHHAGILTGRAPAASAAPTA